VPLLNAVLAMALSSTSPQDDLAAVAALDTAYQAAVERNDAETMARILHKDMILVRGQGDSHTREELLVSAREKHHIFEHQVEVPGTRTVRLYGHDTAIVSAQLSLKGADADGKNPFDFRLWFTDTYVRTPQGWRYAFAQAATPLPPGPQ
jgi:ketosteroid isomerase-like protein